MRGDSNIKTWGSSFRAIWPSLRKEKSKTFPESHCASFGYRERMSATRNICLSEQPSVYTDTHTPPTHTLHQHLQNTHTHTHTHRHYTNKHTNLHTHTHTHKWWVHLTWYLQQLLNWLHHHDATSPKRSCPSHDQGRTNAHYPASMSRDHLMRIPVHSEGRGTRETPPGPTEQKVKQRELLRSRLHYQLGYVILTYSGQVTQGALITSTRSITH